MKYVSRTTWYFMIAMISVLTSFWITRSAALAHWQNTNPVWLQNVASEVIQNEEVFNQWVEKTRQTLKDERLELGRLLENPQTQDLVISAQTEKISHIHADLLRGIGRHLTSIRSTLPDSQKLLLSEFCLQALRGPGQGAGFGKQEQHRRQQGQSEQSGSGNGFRRGQRQGNCGFTRRLQLTQEQILIAAQKDPTFENDVRQLQNQVLLERQKLLGLLENQQDHNDQVLQQIEIMITAYNTIEKRLIDYVLMMRPHFTPRQQKCIIGLCSKNNSKDNL